MAEPSGLVITAVRDMKPSTKNVNFIVMVLEPVGFTHRTKDGPEVKTFKVADRTGSINLCVFGENASYLKPGDIVRVKQGYSSLFRNSLTAYVGKIGELKRVGEFCFIISEEPNMSEINFFPQHQLPQQQQQQLPQQDSQHGFSGRSQHNPSTSSFQGPFGDHGQLPMRGNTGGH
ncbi:putative SOSS complex subunit B1-A [Hypsibius exemplaris]|uniref:SOSS complex subunit B1-A n=1 Tax=Hypsibius exemplaris TaxID=2072580 RepID=A0A1W0WTP9_HYPEX|nr:putative SOSS complex subunit B1-A [Hypsibius exemplaris]